MCRFMVYWGNSPIHLSKWIISEKNSLLKQSQSDCSNRPNPDGWGFAFRNGESIKVIKNSNPAYEDENYIPIAKEIYSDLLFAHVRRKSQGTVSLENTHPFVHDNWIFMHNGNIPDFDKCKKKIMRRLPKECQIQTKGSTDSEFLFNYFLCRLKRIKSSNWQWALNIIYSIISQLVELTNPEDQRLLALNFILTNGKYIIGFRRNRTLHYATTQDGVVISSEQLDFDQAWNEIPENHFIISTRPDDIKIVAKDIVLEKI